MRFWDLIIDLFVVKQIALPYMPIQIFMLFEFECIKLHVCARNSKATQFSTWHIIENHLYIAMLWRKNGGFSFTDKSEIACSIICKLLCFQQQQQWIPDVSVILSYALELNELLNIHSCLLNQLILKMLCCDMSNNLDAVLSWSFFIKTCIMFYILAVSICV